MAKEASIKTLQTLQVIRMSYICDPNECKLDEKDHSNPACKACEEGHEALAIAIEAIEKQIPKKPIKEITEYNGFQRYDEYYCPSCRTYITDNCDEEYSKCCDECGQRLDWSEVEK